MQTNERRSHGITRREALGWLGVGAAAVALPGRDARRACRSSSVEGSTVSPSIRKRSEG